MMLVASRETLLGPVDTYRGYWMSIGTVASPPDPGAIAVAGLLLCVVVALVIVVWSINRLENAALDVASELTEANRLGLLKKPKPVRRK
jgi:hypothetical protein